jgi:hypothetical protein
MAATAAGIINGVGYLAGALVGSTLGLLLDKGNGRGWLRVVP